MQRAFSNVGLFAILIGAIGIGFAPILVRLADAGPSATAFWRVLFAFPVLWVWLAVQRHRGSLPLQPATRKQWFMVVCAGLFFTADLAIWHWSLRLTSITNSTLLSNIAPILVTVAAYFIFKERISWLFFVGLLLAIAGVVLLVGGHFDAQHLRGDWLAIVTAAFYAAYLLAIKELRNSFDPITTMAWTGLISCPAFLLVAVLSGDTIMPQSVKGWGAVVALGLVSHVGGQTLIAYALGRLPASFSAVSLLLQPVVAALLAWPILGEPITLRQILGGIVVLGGVALAHQGRAKPFAETPSAA